jgi:hypothetical protein
MVGGGARTVKAVARRRGVALALVVAACGGSYDRQVEAHVALLTAVARKGVDLVGSGRLTAESMPELTYPLERARAFAERESRRQGGSPPPSLLAFQSLVARYRDFVDALDRLRREKSGPDARVALGPPLAAVEAAGEAVRAAIRQEAAGR